MGALYFAADYLEALKALLPRGRVWPKSLDSVQGQILSGLAPQFERADAAAQNLLVDAFPVAPVDLLPEWEETFGLPDPCLGPTPTLQQRQASVAARFAAQGGTQAQFYIDYAAKLGYVITCTPDAPFRVGLNRIGDPIQDESYFFVLHVNSASMDDILKCEMRAIAPAYVQFVFG